MEFKQLEAFISVVEWNSFSLAAKKMYLTQPTISSHIRSLEEELNTTLLTRTTKQMDLTKEGKYLYEEAKKLLSARNNIYEQFRQTESNIIRLGASTIPGLYLLPNILPAFQKKHLVHKFELWQSDSLGVIKGLREGRLDLGLIGTKVNDNTFHFIPFARDEMVIATPANDYYKKLKKENADIYRLVNEPIILRENNSGTRKEGTRFLEKMNILPEKLNVVAQMNDQEMIKSSIRNGLGISIMSGCSVATEEKNGSLLVFHLEHLSSFRSLYIVYEKSKILPKHTQQFIQFLTTAFQKDFPKSSAID